MTKGRFVVGLDVNFYDHPKVVAAGEKADRLYTEALCLAKRTWSDGFVSDPQLARMGLSGWRARADRLVEVGLFERDDVNLGYWIHDWTDYNRTKEEQDAIRAKRSAAGKLGGRPRKQPANQPGKQRVKQARNPDLICSDLTPQSPPIDNQNGSQSFAEMTGLPEDPEDEFRSRYSDGPAP